MTPQYRTIATGAGWLDASTRGRLRFDGTDAASFLHALVSNDVTGTPAGRGVYATWLTPQGRMITDLRILCDRERVLAETPSGLAPALAARFDALIFSEDVRVFDDTASTRQIILFGHRASAIASSAMPGVTAAELDALPVLAHISAGDLRVVRVDEVPLPAFSIWMPAARWDSVLAAVNAGGAVGGDDGAVVFEGLRIEAARPQFGVDMTTETIPLEAGLLDRAISTAKGCYVGQEVIVRILHRGGGRVVKQLVQVVAGDDVRDVPVAGTAVFDEGREVGVVTSAAVGPSTGRVVALAYVHRDSAVAGRPLTLGSGSAVVVAAPAA